MDIKQLEAFVYVVDFGSFSKAGEFLHLTQPTVSAHVAALEHETGVNLMIRNSSQVSPSDAGKILYPYAKKILQTREDAAKAIFNYAHTMKGTVSIAASSIPGQYFLPRIMQSFRQEYPDITFDIQITDSADVVHKVASQDAEIGLSGTKTDSRKCTYRTFASDNLVLITPNNENFRKYLNGRIPLQQILSGPFINREKGSGTRKEAENFLKRSGIDPDSLHTVAEVHSAESIKKMVSEGVGIAIVSQSACKDYCSFRKILMFNLDQEDLKRNLYLVKNRHSILSPAAQAFYNFAKDFYHDK